MNSLYRAQFGFCLLLFIPAFEGSLVKGEPLPERTTIQFPRSAKQSFLGVGASEIDSERAKALKLKEEFGVEITRVEEDGPAASAGMKAGDVVLSYNGARVEGTEQFVRMVRETPPGREVQLVISRAGNVQNLAIRTGVRKDFSAKFPAAFPMPAPDGDMLNFHSFPRAAFSWRNTLLGMEMEPVEAQLAEYFGVKEGVLVRSVAKGSAAERAGLRAGDVIVQADGTKVTEPDQLVEMTRQSRTGKALSLTLVRDKKDTSVTLSTERTPQP